MTLFGFIALAISLALSSMVLLYNAASHTSIRPTTGLLLSFLLGVVQAAALLLGIAIGALLRFDLTEIDKTFFFAMYCIVAIKLLLSVFSRSAKGGSYDFSRVSTMLALAAVSAINPLLLGIGQGFIDDFGSVFVKAFVPILLIVTVFAYLGVMLGRSGKELKSRRWTLIAALFLVVLAIQFGLR